MNTRGNRLGYHSHESTVTIQKPQNCFNVWKGRNVFNQTLSVQIKLQDTGRILLSIRDSEALESKAASTTLEVLHSKIDELICEEENSSCIKQLEINRLRKVLHAIADSRPDEFMDIEKTPELTKWIANTCSKARKGAYSDVSNDE